MIEHRPLVFCLALAMACADHDGIAIGDHEVSLRVHTDRNVVEFGKAFPLTVVRAWQKELRPEEWSDQVLKPLVVQLEATTRREDDRHIEETRRYRAYAFSRDEITVPAASFRARSSDGGAERVASGEELKLRVLPALAPGAPGPADLPGELLPEPRPWGRWSVGAAAAIALLLGLLLLARTVRKRPHRLATSPSMAPAAPAAPPRARALERLQRLREQEPRTAAELEAHYVEASALLRDYLAEQFAVRAPEMTTQELLASRRIAAVLLRTHREILARWLTHCDWVKFGGLVPTSQEREQLLEAAARFVTESPA